MLGGVKMLFSFFVSSSSKLLKYELNYKFVVSLK